MATQAPPGNGSHDQDRIRNLQLEVLRLETKLRDLHASDTVADKRALATLRQHVGALAGESEGLAETLRAVQVDPFDQRLLEEEMGAFSAVALTSYIGDRVLKASKMLDSGNLRGTLWLLSGTYLAWRLTFGLFGKCKRRIGRSRERKAALEQQCERVAARIAVMRQLLPADQPAAGS